MLVQLDFNEKTNKCHIQLSDSDVKERLMTAFSAPNAAKKFVTGARKHWIPDKIHFISPTGSFDYGLTEMILNWLKKYVLDRTVQYNFSENFKKKFTFDEKIVEIHDNLAFKLRDYQKTCVELALKHKFGTFVLGTRSW